MSYEATPVPTRPRSILIALIGTALLAGGAVIAVSSASSASSTTSQSAAAPTELDPSEPQEAFLCTTEWNGLGQPIADNSDGVGTPVYPEVDGDIDRSQDPEGWSKDCQIDEQVEYRYRTTSGQIETLPSDATSLPSDIAMIPADDLVGQDELELDGATEIPHLYRYQRGSLPENRFLYSIAMLVPFDAVTSETQEDWDHSHWNGRLTFSFGGGVGFGHSQGDLANNASQMNEAMRLGHAVVYSSGNRTSTHYNLKLGGRTAMELKDLFVDDHDDPTYTVGIGGSGGGIQQYVYAQNHPSLLDGLIPQYSYPDMTTQTINIGDCELLEHYMDVTDGDNERWQDWDNRKILQGHNTIEGFSSTWQDLVGASGSSECIEGWRGATPAALNPTFGLAVDLEKAVEPYVDELEGLIGTGEPLVPADFPDLGRLLRTSASEGDWIEWTHWADAAEAYGVDPDSGFARSPWDNVGLQYGLRAVANGQITPEEFLHLNARIGSWKGSEDAVPESCGMVEAMANSDVALLAGVAGLCSGSDLDQYSSGMMNLGDEPAPAPRTEGDITAITNAFESGLEFDGELGRDLPILDIRPYLEDELDMHNVHQSFTVRERIRRSRGHVDNHVIWFLDARPSEDDNATDDLMDRAFRTMEDWIPESLDGTPAGEVKPSEAIDSCWDTDGTPIASGDDVWNGAVELSTSGEGAWTDSAPSEVDGVAVGDCASHFPIHSTSRIVAGAPITNDVYKCHLKPVTEAVEDGDYGEWEPTAADIDELEEIFPVGVCDWSRRSVGHPSEGEWEPPETTTTTEATTTTQDPTTTTEASPSTTDDPSDTTDPGPSTTVAPGSDGPGSGEAGGQQDQGTGSMPSTGSSNPIPLVVLAASLVALGTAIVIRFRRRIIG